MFKAKFDKIIKDSKGEQMENRDGEENVVLRCVMAVIFTIAIFLVVKYNLDKEVEIKQAEAKNYETEIAELQGEITALTSIVQNLEKKNIELENRLAVIETVEPEIPVEEEIELSEEDLELFKKFVGYFCKDAPNATRIYVSSVVVNLMYYSKMSFSDAVSSLGVEQSEFENIKYKSEDVTALLRVLNMTHEEVSEVSSGATFFCEDENYQNYIEKGMQVLFTSGNYTFFADFAVG